MQDDTKANIIKRSLDHNVIPTGTCGDFVEILRGGEYEKLDLGIVLDIQATKGHYHKQADEVYFVLDGEISVDLFNPSNNTKQTVTLGSNELCVIKAGTHHKIHSTSKTNRVCVITIPRWDKDDEYLSEVL